MLFGNSEQKQTAVPASQHNPQDIIIAHDNNIFAVVRASDLEATRESFREQFEAVTGAQNGPCHVHIPVRDTLLFSSDPPPWFPKDRLTGSMEDLNNLERECERRGGNIRHASGEIEIPFLWGGRPSREYPGRSEEWQWDYFRNHSFQEAWRFLFEQ